MPTHRLNRRYGLDKSVTGNSAVDEWTGVAPEPEPEPEPQAPPAEQRRRQQALEAARKEAERWYELQSWQLMLRCLRRWHGRVSAMRKRRHVREAKQFVRAQGRRRPQAGRQPRKPPQAAQRASPPCHER